VRACSGRWKTWSQIGRAGIGALVLALTAGCADIWGFNDLTLASDAGLTDGAGVGAPDAGSDGATTTEASAGGEGGGGEGDGGQEASDTCGPRGTILSCGGCNQACDVVQSNVSGCVNDTFCSYRGCADGWQDCDTKAPDTNGCESSTTSTTTCGACGNACDTVHSVSPTCGAPADGGIECQYSGCQTGWKDCDAGAPNTDGCETSLTTAANCGACGRACDTTHSLGATCSDGTTCSYTGCKPGFADCNTTPPDTDGCETPTMSTACDACNTSCDSTTSVGATCDADAGTCRYTKCQAGFADCNTTPPDTNGCETSTTTLANCGACGHSCDTMTSTTPSCINGTCMYGGCTNGFADCNTTPPDTNGCESSLLSTATCGACNATCSTKTGPASCNGKTCSYKCNAGLSDCNAATAPDTDGCECATPGCCGAGCQTTHTNGVGDSFYDCNPSGTHTMAEATAACAAYTGSNSQCSGSSLCCALNLVGLCVGTTSESICGSVQGNCFCWQYSGNAPGTVQAVSGKCTAACGATTDPAWN
jgi:hypothetical protein